MISLMEGRENSLVYSGISTSISGQGIFRIPDRWRVLEDADWGVTRGNRLAGWVAVSYDERSDDSTQCSIMLEDWSNQNLSTVYLAVSARLWNETSSGRLNWFFREISMSIYLKGSSLPARDRNIILKLRRGLKRYIVRWRPRVQLAFSVKNAQRGDRFLFWAWRLNRLSYLSPRRSADMI